MSQINKYTNWFLSEWNRKTGSMHVLRNNKKENRYANIIWYFKMTEKFIKKDEQTSDKNRIFSHSKRCEDSLKYASTLEDEKIDPLMATSHRRCENESTGRIFAPRFTGK